MARATHLLSMWGTAVVDSGAAGDGPTEEGEATPESSQSSEINELIFMKENMRLGPFQTQILKCRTRPLLGESAYVMVMPLKVGESQLGGGWPLPLGLYVLNACTRLKMSSNKVSVIVRNMSDCPIFLKKGIQVAWVVSASPVPPVELSPGMKAIFWMETMWVPMSVTAQQEKLLKNLNLDGLSN